MKCPPQLARDLSAGGGLRVNHIQLSYTWVKLALQGAGLVKKGRKRGVHRKRRPRRPLPGMLLHLDGSEHRWFQDERWYDLIVVLDDATSLREGGRMKRYPEGAWERATKVQEVILRAMAKRLTWWQAAEILGISVRTMRRWRWRYKQYGYDGLFDRRRGQPSPKRLPLKTVEEVLQLYQEKYFDLNVRHFHEKLREEHGIQLSRDLLRSTSRGRIDARGDGGAARSNRAEGPVLRALQRPGEPLLRDAQGGRAGQSATADAGGTGAAGAGDSNDSQLLSPGARADGTEF